VVDLRRGIEMNAAEALKRPGTFKTGGSSLHPRNANRATRRGWSLLEVVTTISALAVLTSIAVYAYVQYKERAFRDVCFTQQRRLQKQIESIQNVDFNVPMDEIFKQLVQSGALAGQVASDGTPTSIGLQDPSYGPGSHGHYQIMMGTRMVGCSAHGSPFLGE
jgi:hypothetical protein